MKREEYLRSETVAIQHCATRAVCPLASICSADPERESSTITPALTEVPKDGLVWVDLRHEHRVVAIKSGLFAVITVDGEEEELFSVYGPGYCCGLSELYLGSSVCSTYYMKALTDCTVCLFPANAFRHRLESLPASESNRLVSCALTNWTTASFELLKLFSKTKNTERLALLLRHLREQSGRSGDPFASLRLSHDELAFLLRSNRASVTRALHQLEKDGLVSLGHKTITFCPHFNERAASYGDSNLRYHKFEPSPL